MSAVGEAMCVRVGGRVADVLDVDSGRERGRPDVDMSVSATWILSATRTVVMMEGSHSLLLRDADCKMGQQARLSTGYLHPPGHSLASS